VAGGWLVEFDGYGVIKTHVHEALAYPENDTMRSRYPLANILTGSTMARREDLLLTSPVVVLPDYADPTLPGGSFSVDWGPKTAASVTELDWPA
jgi:hypothetical protein